MSATNGVNRYTSARYRDNSYEQEPRAIEKSRYVPKKDRRVNLYDIEKETGSSPDLVERIQSQTKNSIACLVLVTNLLQREKIYECRYPNRTLAKQLEEEKGEKFGEKEKFGNELPLGWGTAFLIAPQFALTAAHCIYHENQDLTDKLHVVFGFHKQTSGTEKWTFAEKQVYRIQQVVAYNLKKIGETWQDWALLQLDRPVEGGVPLTLDFQPTTKEMPLYMLGHSSGLPLKLTYGANIQKESHSDYFEADLDAFMGNSGSPVFNEITGNVVGIFFNGRWPDYKVRENSRRICGVLVSQEDIKNYGYEKCQKISALAFIQLSLPLIKEGKQGKDLILDVVCQDISLIQYISEELKNDRNFVDIIKQNNWINQFSEEKVRIRIVPARNVGSAPGIYVFATCANANCSNYQTGKWIRYERAIDELSDIDQTYGSGGVKCLSCNGEFKKEAIADKLAFYKCNCIVRYGISEKYGGKVEIIEIINQQGHTKIMEWDFQSLKFVTFRTT